MISADVGASFLDAERLLQDLRHCSVVAKFQTRQDGDDARHVIEQLRVNRLAHAMRALEPNVMLVSLSSSSAVKMPLGLLA
jgi:hypothetical protein